MLLREARRRAAYHLAVRALVLTDRHAEARRAIDALRAAARARLAAAARGRGAGYAAELALRTGDVADAERDARAGARARRRRHRAVRGGALEVLVRALAERGAFDEARELLRARLDGALGRARRCATPARGSPGEGDYERAYTEAREAGAARDAPGARTRPGRLALDGRASRSPTSAAATRRPRWPTPSSRGPSASARPVPLATALHARAVAEPDADARVALCRRALAVGGRAPVLEAVRVRLELGSALAYARARASRRATRCARRWPTPTRRARCRSPSARGASSSPPACARARRRSRAPRR